MGGGGRKTSSPRVPCREVLYPQGTGLCMRATKGQPPVTGPAPPPATTPADWLCVCSKVHGNVATEDSCTFCTGWGKKHGCPRRRLECVGRLSEKPGKDLPGHVHEVGGSGSIAGKGKGTARGLTSALEKGEVGASLM